MKSEVHSSELKLLSNQAEGFRTDHIYTMVLVLKPKNLDVVPLGDTCRYRISRLNDHARRLRLITEVDARITAHPTYFRTGHVDRINRRITKLLQTVCGLILGVIPVNGASSTYRTCDGQDQQTVTRSTELYKAAAASSKENDPITVIRRAQGAGISALQ